MKSTLFATVAAFIVAIVMFVGVARAQSPSPTPTPTPAADDLPEGAPNTGYGIMCDHK